MEDEEGVEEVDQGFLAELDQAIGHVARASAWLEDATRALYATMLGASEAAFLVAAGLSFDQARTACFEVQKALSWHPDPHRFKTTLEQGRALMDQRSHIVHAVWLKIEGTQPIGFRSRRWRRGAGQFWSVEEMHALGEQLSDVGRRVQELAREHVER